MFNRVRTNPDYLRKVALATPIVALLAKIWLITHVLYVAGGPIDSVGFGFGDYVHNLLLDGHYKSCATIPFRQCATSMCVYATRMPAWPVAVALLAKLVGPSLISVAIAKATLLSAMTWLLLAAWVRRRDLTPMGVALIAFVLLGPQVLKHASVIDYEEGVICEMMFCLATAVGLTLVKPRHYDTRGQVALSLLTIVLAGLMYLAKTTLAPLLVITTALSLSILTKRRWAYVAIVCASIALAMGAWFQYTGAVSGRATLSSSWNGENLFRGNSADAMSLYPDVSLDRAFDSDWAVVDDGRRVPLGNWSNRQCYSNEWAWNDHYHEMAVSWLREHPADAMRLTFRRAWVFFVDIQPVPRRVSATDPARAYGFIERTAGELWMLLGRVAFCAFLLLTVRDWRVGIRRSAWPLAVLLSYAAPYVAVFTWQRHVVPFLIATGVFLAIRLSYERETRAAPGALV